MEKSANNGSFGAQNTQQEAEYSSVKNEFTFRLFRVFFFVLIMACVTVGIWTNTVHNIMFGAMFYGLYRAIKYEEFDHGRK